MGDRIIIEAGQSIAGDGTVVSGLATVDEKALTGESDPKTRNPGDRVLAATVVAEGQIVVRVDRAGGDTTASKIVKILGGAQSDFARTRAALSSLREALANDPVRAKSERVSALDVDGALGGLEAQTRRGMLEWGARLIIRGFAEAYLPLVAYLEAPTLEELAAMDLVVCDG